MHGRRDNTGLVYHDDFLRHQTGAGHPERPERLAAIVEHLRRGGLLDRLTRVEPRPASPDEVGLVHDPGYVRRLEHACRTGQPFIDSADSAICCESYRIALLAAGGVLAACDRVVGGEIRNAFCAVRPPGHHAERDLSMGFCLINNVAVAARYLQRRHGIGKVLILDWDVHHGNGTQHVFEEDPSVFFCSLHEHPTYCYPGTGWAWETGKGPGRDTTLNLPMMPGWGDAEYKAAFITKFLPAAEAFAPDFILLSAGFDAHADDPLAHMQVSTECFEWMGRQVVKLADKCCQGRLVSVLEGGYHLDRLAECVSGHVRRLMDDEPSRLMEFKTGFA